MPMDHGKMFKKFRVPIWSIPARTSRSFARETEIRCPTQPGVVNRSITDSSWPILAEGEAETDKMDAVGG